MLLKWLLKWSLIGNLALNLLRALIVIVSVVSFPSACTTLGSQPSLISARDQAVMKMEYCKLGQFLKSEKKTLHSSLRAVDADEIKILNWNLFKGKKSDWKSDLVDFSKDADLILIQEAIISDELFDSLHQSMSWDVTHGFSNENVKTGVLTASNVASVSRCGFRHKEPLIRTPKTALVTEYPILDREKNLLVGNVHAINFTWGLTEFRNQLVGVLSLLAEHDGPIILAGDFNTWRDKRVRILFELVDELGLSEVLLEEDHRTQAFGQSLDFIFYKGLVCNKAGVFQVSSSDHNPIHAVFEYRE